MSTLDDPDATIIQVRISGYVQVAMSCVMCAEASVTYAGQMEVIPHVVSQLREVRTHQAYAIQGTPIPCERHQKAYDAKELDDARQDPGDV